jgi:cell division protein FtsL
MYRSIEWLQAVRQAPWRKQLQMVGLLAGGVVIFVIVAAVYLNVSSRAATLGREIQDMQETARDLERVNEDLETRLAYITARETMAERAAALGYTDLTPDQILYLQVPGYGGRQVAQLAQQTDPQDDGPVRLPAAYTQSLIEWARQMFDQIALQTGALGGGRN